MWIHTMKGTLINLDTANKIGIRGKLSLSDQVETLESVVYAAFSEEDWTLYEAGTRIEAERVLAHIYDCLRAGDRTLKLSDFDYRIELVEQETDLAV